MQASGDRLGKQPPLEHRLIEEGASRLEQFRTKLSRM